MHQEQLQVPIQAQSFTELILRDLQQTSMSFKLFQLQQIRRFQTDIFRLLMDIQALSVMRFLDTQAEAEF